MLRHERLAWASGRVRVAGVDEAGRGPLAGPVVAAAFVFPAALLRRGVPKALRGIDDSKKLSAARRDACFEVLTDPARGFTHAVAIVGPAEIDRINILRATHVAMARALADLAPPAEFALVDGLPVPGLPVPSESVVKGDQLSLSIAAASIVAKVTRDRIMRELAVRHPEYGFERHMGYGTAEHLAALRRHGPCPAHRRSFRPVLEQDLFDPPQAIPDI